jgi:hypothetical protein
MKRKISIVRYVLLVLSLGMVAGSMVWHRAPSQSLSAGDPTQLTHPELAEYASEIPVQVTTPAGTSWKYVDFSKGKNLAEFLSDLGEELFGKAAYAMGAPVITENRKAKNETGKRDDFRFSNFDFRSGAPRQMAEPGSTSAAVGISVGKHRELAEQARPRVPNMVHIVARHKDGTIFYDKWFHNLRTNAGINWQQGQMATSATAAALASGTYSSGGTITGSSGQTCTLTAFNGSGAGATATVALTGTNTIATGTAITVTAAGAGFTSAPTSATLGSGTATCSGTATISTTLAPPPALAACEYIALSNSGATPAATDTSLASEITANGLSRALGTVSHTANATSYTVSYTFTATGSQSAQNAGLFNASTAGYGTLCFENTFAQVSMASGDTLAVSWTINF